MRLRDALFGLEADKDLAGVLGDYFVPSVPTYTRNAIDQIERSVTDWESPEDAYHL